MCMTSPITKNNEKSYDLHANDWHNAMATNFGHKYLEKPAMTSLLPESLQAKSVLCIGVGTGEELSELINRSPREVVAIDISEELLKITASKFPDIELHKMDMMDLAFASERFDYVYSSLALHYANDWDKLLTGIFRVLKQNGHLIFSTHNPAYWGKKPATGESYTNLRGVRVSEHQDTLPGGVEITYYNLEVQAEIKEAVEHAGFTLEKSFEPEVREADLTSLSEAESLSYTKLKTKNALLPLFYIVSATKS